MPEAKVTLVFRINVELVSDFVTKMQEHAETLADSYRCPDVIEGDDLRCQLRRDHNGDRHVHDRFSWPVAQDNLW